MVHYPSTPQEKEKGHFAAGVSAFISARQRCPFASFAAHAPKDARALGVAAQLAPGEFETVRCSTQTRSVWDCQSGLPYIRPGVVPEGSIDRQSMAVPDRSCLGYVQRLGTPRTLRARKKDTEAPSITRTSKTARLQRGWSRNGIYLRV